MLIELAVRDLGTIAEARLLLGPGMTALTGETGAGKTLVVEAIELLVGGRADPSVVRPGADEARVEGRAVIDGDEVVLERVVPRQGRSRAYVDGRLATASTLAELGRRLVDLHGQHAHQSLLATATQRAALDRHGAVDLGPLVAARQRLVELDAELAALGGDERARAREIDLYRFQVAELDAAGITDPDEDAALEAEEDTLADAVAHQEAAAAAVAALTDEAGAVDAVGLALAAVAGRAPYRDLEARLRGLAAELADVATELRDAGEAIEHDPARLAQVRERRQLLHELRRKYGETLAEVVDYHRTAAERLAELEDHDARAARLDAERAEVARALARAEAAVGAARRAAAGPLAAAIEARLVELAMPAARVSIAVGDDPGDDVTFLLAANPGAPPLPLARTASGGELARAMLATRLVLTAGPPTLVFDEVDAGIGGEAAHAVGRALAALGADHQVLVVTHLAQVAAHADDHVTVTKDDDGATTTSALRRLDRDARIVELSRMLSGSPDSESARAHAWELLARADEARLR